MPDMVFRNRGKQQNADTKSYCILAQLKYFYLF